MREKIKKVLTKLSNMIVENTKKIKQLKCWKKFFEIKFILTLVCVLACLYFSKDFWLYKKNITEYSYTIDFNYCIIAIITITTAIFFYGIFSVIENIKKREQLNFSDIILTLIFIVMLFVPASRIMQNDISLNENRTLTKFTPLFTNKKINNSFGKNFESWFNDRFYTRELFIDIYKKTFEKVNRYYNDKRVVADKKTGWFFYKSGFSIYKKALPIDFINIKLVLSQFTDFCNQIGTKIYFVFVPVSQNVYREYVPFYPVDNKVFFQQFEKYFEKEKKLGFTYIYPLKELLLAKNNSQDRLFFSTDNHMTQTGGYVVYETVMDIIKKDFPDIKSTKLDVFRMEENTGVDYKEKEYPSFGNGNLNEGTLNEKKYLNYAYKYYYPKEDKSVGFETYDDPYLIKSKAHNQNGKYNALLLGSSYTEASKLYFAQSFKNTTKIRLNNAYEKNFHVSRFADYIKETKPDIIIVFLAESEVYDYVSTMYNDHKELEL